LEENRMSRTLVAVFFGLGAGSLAAQEHKHADREGEAQIKAIRENYRETVERSRREMETRIAALQAACREGTGAGHETGDKPRGCRRETSCEHAESGRPKGNNGVGNGVDPQPPGNPPVNDGPGTGPGNPGNKGGGKAKPEKGRSGDHDGKGKHKGGRS
jgi:hypothetical protein